MVETDRVLAGFPGTSGDAVKNLDTDERMCVDADEVTATGSTSEVPILIELVRQVEEESVNLDQRVEVTEAARSLGSGM